MWLRPPLALARALALVFALAGTAAAQGKLPYTALATYIGDVEAATPKAGSEGFVEPSAGERDDFTRCLGLLLRGDTAHAVACLDPLGYALDRLDDTAARRSYAVAYERSASRRGLGTWVFDSAAERNVVVVAPHPLFDSRTPVEAARVFQGLAARALFLGGTHRCANAALSPCSGTTSACGGGPVHVSDPPHYDRNFLFSAHRALAALSPPPLAIDLHGNAAEPVEVELSDGTTQAAATGALVLRVRQALLDRGVSAGSCNWPGDTGLTLCGTNNVDGRLHNGSPAPCTTAASAASGRFLHVEQRSAIRSDPTPLIDALREALAPDWPQPTRTRR